MGLPVEWSRKKINDLEWIREKVLGKIEGWKECLLNQAGKKVLIKAAIQAIPIYAMALVRLPKNFCRELCSRVARFWWSGYGKSRGIHWRKWEVLAQSKMEGGMGFKDFNHLNSAMLAKQAWRVLTNPNALWVSVLKSCYFPNSSFMQAKRKRNDSWAWASLLHGRDILRKGGRWIVGNGESIDVEADNWLASGAKARLRNEGVDIRVRELIDQNQKG